MKLAGCEQLTPVPDTGTRYRAVRPSHFPPRALSTAHSATVPGRFNPGTVQQPGHSVLYLADNPQTCLLEVGALLGSPRGPVANPAAGAWTVFPVRVQFSRLADLCDQAQRSLIGASVQELTGDWRGYALRPHTGQPPSAPTQRLGIRLYKRPLEGLLTYSARDTTRRNLVVFPTRMRPGSHVELLDPATGDVVAAVGPGGAVLP